MHWGYWEDPRRAGGGIPDFQAAMERLNSEVLAAAELRDGHTILDAGCGFGGTLAGLDSFLRGASLIGVNIDPRQLALAARARGGGNELFWLRADACRLPVAPGTLDRVLAVECIFHFPSRRLFLKEAARALRPGGRLVLSDFVPMGAGTPSLGLGSWLEREVAKGYGTLGEGFPRSYAEMAAEAGLEIILDRDITRQTLPTYPVLLGLLKMPGSGPLRKATRILQGLSRLRLLRYRILAFLKKNGVRL